MLQARSDWHLFIGGFTTCQIHPSAQATRCCKNKVDYATGDSLSPQKENIAMEQNHVSFCPNHAGRLIFVSGSNLTQMVQHDGKKIEEVLEL